MKKLLVACALILSLFAVTAMAAELTGWISDSKCGAKGAKAAHANCAEKCVKAGAAPVLVVGDKVYKIDDASKVAEHVGHKVTVEGTVNESDNTIKVDTVKMASD